MRIFVLNLNKYEKYTLKAASKIVVYKILSFFSRESKTWHFMWIVCLADSSHEMPSLIFGVVKPFLIKCYSQKNQCVETAILGEIVCVE